MSDNHYSGVKEIFHASKAVWINIGISYMRDGAGHRVLGHDVDHVTIGTLDDETTRYIHAAQRVIELDLEQKSTMNRARDARQAALLAMKQKHGEQASNHAKLMCVVEDRLDGLMRAEPVYAAMDRLWREAGGDVDPNTNDELPGISADQFVKSMEKIGVSKSTAASIVGIADCVFSEAGEDIDPNAPVFVGEGGEVYKSTVISFDEATGEFETDDDPTTPSSNPAWDAVKKTVKP